jgi:hypothetical protein
MIVISIIIIAIITIIIIIYTIDKYCLIDIIISLASYKFIDYSVITKDDDNDDNDGHKSININDNKNCFKMIVKLMSIIIKNKHLHNT